MNYSELLMVNVGSAAIDPWAKAAPVSFTRAPADRADSDNRPAGVGCCF
jgi:hypothetical protein